MAETNGNGHGGVVLSPADERVLEKAQADLTEIGVTGLVRYSGLVDEEFLPQLKGSRARAVYREMSDNDPIVGAELLAIDLLLRRVQWDVEPADVPEQAKLCQEIADHVLSCISDMETSWSDTLSQVYSMLPFGWSWHEVVYKLRRGDTGNPETQSKHEDGRYGWRKLAIRSQETLLRWQFDDTSGDVVAMVQSAAPSYVPTPIPYEKSLLFRTTAAKGNPEGRSILRNAYRPWYFKRRIEELEGIGIERDLAGLPMARVPSAWLSSDATASQKQAVATIKQIATRVRRNEQEGLVFPIEFDDKGNEIVQFKLLTTGGTRQINLDATIARYDQRISMTALSDFLLLGHEKVGAYSLGVSKVEVFTAALGAWLEQVAGEFNARALPQLVKLNGWPVQLTPTLKHGNVESIDIKEVAQFVSLLAQAGAPVFPNTPLLEYLLSIANLPAPTDTGGGAVTQ